MPLHDSLCSVRLADQSDCQLLSLAARYADHLPLVLAAALVRHMCSPSLDDKRMPLYSNNDKGKAISGGKADTRQCDKSFAVTAQVAYTAVQPVNTTAFHREGKKEIRITAVVVQCIEQKPQTCISS